MKDFPDLRKPSHLIVTLFGIGKIPFAPGTFASIIAWIIFVYISHFIDNIFLLTLFIFIISIWLCEKASFDLDNRDHKAIVIDELVGMWIALLPAVYFFTTQEQRSLYAIFALIFFRIFDIFKPFPISYFDKKLKNGFGIVFDDVIAACYSILATFILLIALSFFQF